MRTRLQVDDLRDMDRADELRAFRDRFWIPAHGQGERVYLCGNSLGLQPKDAAAAVAAEMAAWKDRAVAGHFEGERPWTRYHELLRDPMAGLCGAEPGEVVAMNSLTVNLHLLMVSFFRPRGARQRVVIERQAFPSDRYAVASQLRYHGLDPAQCLVEIGGDRLIDEHEVEDYLRREGERVALLLWPGVHYATGQRFDMARLTAAAHAAGAVAGFDLAHAIGNTPLQLHDDGPDFAVWCTYKYLNGGPGSVAGAFIHERHLQDAELPRWHGWWGNDPASRFLMQPEFQAAPGADAWQVSNPAVLAMAPLSASLNLFEAAGMSRLRDKSMRLTAVLERLVRERADDLFEIITPANPRQRGCQLSLRVRGGRAAGRRLFEQLLQAGVTGDWREPDVIRVAPVPLYNRFADCGAFIDRALACANT